MTKIKKERNALGYLCLGTEIVYQGMASYYCLLCPNTALYSSIGPTIYSVSKKNDHYQNKVLRAIY